MEGDALHTQNIPYLRYFNPLPPCGGRPPAPSTPLTRSVFQSTPSVWRETRRRVDSLWKLIFQSTPSVWRETDIVPPNKGRDSDFNPLPPCGGRRITGLIQQVDTSFQSTPSVWRETGTYTLSRDLATDFNPLPPCGGRLCRSEGVLSFGSFQSTPSVWRETENGRLCDTPHAISIHSLRVEGDMILSYIRQC